MESILDAELGVSARALVLHARRAELLAANVANADTPNYKARDIDFRAVLAAAGEDGDSMSMTATNTAHLHGAAVPSEQPQLKYRIPLAPALDGNTVDEQLEQAAFAENTVRHQAALSFVNDAFRGLMLAITGQ